MGKDRASWTRWVAAGLAALTGAWMLFDGARALSAGDYLTPSSGEYAGQLGPWASVLTSVGLDPRSTGVKVAFVVHGASLLSLAAAHAAHAHWVRRPLVVVAALGLWYVPFGTLLNAGAIALLVVEMRREHR